MIFLSFVVIFALLQESCYATSQYRIETQRKQTKAKINHLRWLENLETNKLYKNQQKLEQTNTDLNTSKVNYSNAQNKLSQLQGDLAK